MEGVHVVTGRARGSGDESPPVWSRDKAPVRSLRDAVPQKLKQSVKLAYIFQTFSCIKFWHGLERIFCIHTIQIFFEDSMGGFEPP